MGRVFTPGFDRNGNLAGLTVTGMTTSREVDAAGAQRIAALIRLNEPEAAAKETPAAPARKPALDPGL